MFFFGQCSTNLHNHTEAEILFIEFCHDRSSANYLTIMFARDKGQKHSLGINCVKISDS